MPKNMPKENKNWGVEVNIVGEDGKLVYGADGKVLKKKVRMVMGGLQTDHPSHFILQITIKSTQANSRGWLPSLLSGDSRILARSELSVLDSSARKGQQIVAAVAFFTTSLTLLKLSLFLRHIARLEAFKLFSY